MKYCSHCDGLRNERLKSHCNGWAASDGTVAGSHILFSVDQFFGGIFETIAKALQGNGHLPLRLLRRKPNVRIQLRFAFVDAPLASSISRSPQVACCFPTPQDNKGLAIACPKCGHENYTSVFNVRFFVLCSHLLANLGRNSPGTTPLNVIFEALFDKSKNYRSLDFPKSVSLELALAGIGTVLAHEIGHVLKCDFPEFEFNNSGMHSVFANNIVEELNADRNAIRTLTSSQMVTSVMNKKALTQTLLGTELVLRALHVVERRTSNRYTRFEDLPLVCKQFYPSPRLRCEALWDYGKALGSLGLIDAELWQNERTRTFGNWEELIDGIV